MSNNLKGTFLALTAAILPFGSAISAPPLVDIHSAPIALYDACFSDAIERGDVLKRDKLIQFTCRGNIAETFFNVMGNYGYVIVNKTEPRVGSYRLRSTSPNDQCYQMVEDASGNAEQDYACQLVFNAGDFLNK